MCIPKIHVLNHVCTCIHVCMGPGSYLTLQVLVLRLQLRDPGLQLTLALLRLQCFPDTERHCALVQRLQGRRVQYEYTLNVSP